MAEQPDHPTPTGSAGPRVPGQAPTPAPPPPSSPAPGQASVPAWQGPAYYNQSAAAAGATLHVEPQDLLAAAKALAEHVEQSTAAAGLRVEPRAAGHPNAATALTALAERFHTTLAALDADQGAAVGNLRASARIYETVEVRVRDDLLSTLDHSLAGGTRLTPGGPAFPTQGPGR
jgi:hypothetical protein